VCDGKEPVRVASGRGFAWIRIQKRVRRGVREWCRPVVGAELQVAHSRLEIEMLEHRASCKVGEDGVPI
jgi:hypothetical protein